MSRHEKHLNTCKRRAAKTIAKLYKVKISQKDCGAYGGSASYSKNTLNISHSYKTIDGFISCCFHEAGHIYCYRNRIYSAYHTFTPLSEMSKRDKQALRLTAWKAERFVDAWAKKEMKKHFPQYKYTAGYESQEDKKWLYKHFLDIYFK